MTMVPCSRWPLAEHIAFGQNTFDVSIGSVVSFCIGTSCRWIPIFSSPPHFHRLVGLYRFPSAARFWLPANLPISLSNFFRIRPFHSKDIMRCSRATQDETWRSYLVLFRCG